VTVAPAHGREATRVVKGGLRGGFQQGRHSNQM
jgi:hypothetical protein